MLVCVSSGPCIFKPKPLFFKRYNHEYSTLSCINYFTLLQIDENVIFIVAGYKWDLLKDTCVLESLQNKKFNKPPKIYSWTNADLRLLVPELQYKLFVYLKYAAINKERTKRNQFKLRASFGCEIANFKISLRHWTQGGTFTSSSIDTEQR